MIPFELTISASAVAAIVAMVKHNHVALWGVAYGLLLGAIVQMVLS